jgi:large subunit ribosomal protein L37Ae
MTDDKKLNGRFGPRYGRKVRSNYLAIDVKQRQRQECPYCSGKATRQASGVFECSKCNVKFTADAYTV